MREVRMKDMIVGALPNIIAGLFVLALIASYQLGRYHGCEECGGDG